MLTLPLGMSIGLDEGIKAIQQVPKQPSQLTDIDKLRLSKPYSGMRIATKGTVGGQPIDKQLPGKGLGLDDEPEPLDGEHWLDDSGNATFADGDIGDMNHEGYAIDQAHRDVADAFGVDAGDEVGSSDWQDIIRQVCKNNPRYGELLAAEDWDTPAHKQMLDETGLDPETALVAQGYGDPRLWAAKHHGWTRMAGNSLQTVGIDGPKMQAIADGIYDAHQLYDIPGEHKFDLEVVHPEAAGVHQGQEFSSRLYQDVPMSVLESGDMNELRKYDSNYQELADEEGARSGAAAYPEVIRYWHNQGRGTSNLPSGMELSNEEVDPLSKIRKYQSALKRALDFGDRAGYKTSDDKDEQAAVLSSTASHMSGLAKDKEGHLQASIAHSVAQDFLERLANEYGSYVPESGNSVARRPHLAEVVMSPEELDQHSRNQHRANRIQELDSTPEDAAKQDYYSDLHHICRSLASAHEGMALQHEEQLGSDPWNELTYRESTNTSPTPRTEDSEGSGLGIGADNMALSEDSQPTIVRETDLYDPRTPTFSDTSLRNFSNHLLRHRKQSYQAAKEAGVSREELTRLIKGMKAGHARIIEAYNKVMTNPEKARREYLRKKGYSEGLIDQVGDTFGSSESLPKLMPSSSQLPSYEELSPFIDTGDPNWSDLPPGMKVLPDRPAEQTPRNKKPARAIDAVDPHKKELPPGMVARGRR